MFLWNLLIAVLWSSFMGDMSLLSFSIGFLLGFGALGWLRSAVGHSRYADRLIHVVRLVALVLWELVVSNLRVAHDVITPRHRSRPGIIGYALEAESDVEITVFATVVSFMPGTVIVDISEDRKTLFLHAMFLDERMSFCEHLRERIERPLLEVLRA